MLKRARHRKADRRNQQKKQELRPSIWLDVHGVKVPPHAINRAWGRIKDPSATEIVLRLGHIIEHPECIKKGKGGRLIFDDGEYRAVVISKRKYRKYRKYRVIATVIADKS